MLAMPVLMASIPRCASSFCAFGRRLLATFERSSASRFFSTSVSSLRTLTARVAAKRSRRTFAAVAATVARSRCHFSSTVISSASAISAHWPLGSSTLMVTFVPFVRTVSVVVAAFSRLALAAVVLALDLADRAQPVDGLAPFVGGVGGDELLVRRAGEDLPVRVLAEVGEGLVAVLDLTRRRDVRAEQHLQPPELRGGTVRALRPEVDRRFLPATEQLRRAHQYAVPTPFNVTVLIGE